MTFTPIILGSGYLGYTQLKTTEDAQREALSNSAEVSREIEYAREKLGSVSTSDELLADRRLLEVALTAYGLEDQIDNTPIIKRVLDEGTEDEDAFANLLNDSRWVEFSKDMGFGDSSGTSDISGFAAIVENRFRNAQAASEPELDPADLAHYRANIENISSIDDLLADTTTLDVALQAFGLERGYYTDEHFRQLLTEGVDDSANDYAYTLEDDAWVSFATAFQGLEDGGTVPTVTPFRLDIEREIIRRDVTLYDTDEAAASATKISADDVAYFQENIDTITTGAELVADATLREVALAAYGLTGTSLSDAAIAELLDNAVAGNLDTADAQSDSGWKMLAQSFADSVNAGVEGTVPFFAYVTELGIATEELEVLDYLEEEDNSVSNVTDDDLAYFIENIQNVESIDEFLADEKLLNVGLAAFGLENSGKSEAYLREILEEDATDETAFVNQLSDTRWADFASAFQGVGAEQAVWQSELEQRLVDLDAPAEDIEYLRANWDKIDENLDLVLYPELRDIVLSAFDLPKDSFTGEFFTSMIISDPDDPNSFVNLYDDDRWKELVEMMGTYASEGGNLSDDDYVEEVIDMYENKRFEIAVGEQDQNMRLALNFERLIGDYSEKDNWYSILADEPLRTVLDSVFSTPDGFIQLDLEDQVVWYENQSRQMFGDSTPAVFADSENIEEALRRYLAAIDAESTSGVSLTTPGYSAISVLSNAATNAQTGFGTY